MSLKSFFPEQFDQIKRFLISPIEAVRIIKIDSEMKPMFFKALAKMEEAPDFPHVFAHCEEKFLTGDDYCGHLLKLAKNSYEIDREALIQANIHFEPPPASGTERLSFINYVSKFANSFPEHFGSLTFIIDPETVDDIKDYREIILYLAQSVYSMWVKFLVLDTRTSPLLEDLSPEDKRITYQTFYLSSEEIEKRATQDLAVPHDLTEQETRQYKGLLAGFAFANKDYDKAQALQQKWVDEAETAGEPPEMATAYYNLGNTLLGKGEYALATEKFNKVCELCLDHQITGLMPFAYTNLGIALHRQGEFDAAYQSLKVSRDIFKAQDQRAGEAYIVDCLAQMYVLDGRKEEAEQTWRFALSLYDSMESPTFAQVKSHGREDILQKLEALQAMPSSATVEEIKT